MLLKYLKPNARCTATGITVKTPGNTVNSVQSHAANTQRPKRGTSGEANKSALCACDMNTKAFCENFEAKPVGKNGRASPSDLSCSRLHTLHVDLSTRKPHSTRLTALHTLAALPTPDRNWSSVTNVNANACSTEHQRSSLFFHTHKSSSYEQK